MNGESAASVVSAGQLILFVTNGSPRSRRARDNLARALEQAGSRDSGLTIIDLLKQPQKITEYRVFATPALLSQTDSGEFRVMYGDLSDAETLRRFLADHGVETGDID